VELNNIRFVLTFLLN
jgi:hypothetical protein